MEVNVVKIKASNSRNEWFYIIPLGDIHLGNVGCDINKLRRQVEYIQDKKNCYWIGMGDYVDCINYTDKRFDPTTIAKPFIDHLTNCVPLQVKKIIEILTPIKNKCLGLHRGNHEEKIRLKYQYDIMAQLSEALDTITLKDAAITRLMFKRRTKTSGSTVFDIFSSHGASGSRKGGAQLNRLEDMIGYVDADIYLIGHSHKKTTASRSVLYLDSGFNLRHRKRVMAVTGCFLNGYVQGSSSYVEKWGYPPTSTGCVKIMINPRKCDIHISE